MIEIPTTETDYYGPKQRDRTNGTALKLQVQFLEKILLYNTLYYIFLRTRLI